MQALPEQPQRSRPQLRPLLGSSATPHGGGRAQVVARCNSDLGTHAGRAFLFVFITQGYFYVILGATARSTGDGKPGVCEQALCLAGTEA